MRGGTVLGRVMRELTIDGAAVAWAAVAVEACARIVERQVETHTSPRAGLVVFALQVVLQVGAAVMLTVPRLLCRQPSRLAGLGGLACMALFGAGGGYALGHALVSGSWISKQSFAGWILWGVTGSIALGAALGVFLWHRSKWFRNPIPRVVLWLVTAAAAVGATVVNVLVFPGQYREEHVAVAFLAACFGHLVTRELFERALRWEWRVANGPVFGGAFRVLSGVAALLFVASQVPPPRILISEILLGSERGAVLVRALLRPPKAHEIYDVLARLDMKTPYVAASEAGKPHTLKLPDNWNIILVVVDTLRADTLPPARDRRPHPRFTRKQTPFLSKLVGKSFRFERAYANATYTYKSMPALFRSRYAFDDTVTGTPFAAIVAEYGKLPVAVVVDYFVEPWNVKLRQMIDGYAQVEVYPETQQNELQTLTTQVLDRAGDQPFFAWIHFFSMHSPGWAGTRLSNRSWPRRYGRALRWTDKQVATLWADLERRKLADHTVLVFTADHGEGLMDNGHMTHGTNVLEETARVPLFIHIPGRKGRLIKATVGNIDIVPTIVDLLGGEPRVGHRGKSLVPLLTRSMSESDWHEPYVIVSGNGEQSGVVMDSQKHVYDQATRTHMHFDLDRDPLEEHDAYDGARPAHLRLLAELVERDPGEFVDELKDTGTIKLLDRRLAEVDLRSPPKALPFLLELVKLTPNPQRLAWAQKLFAQTESDAVRLLLLDDLFDLEPVGFGALVRRRIEELAKTHAEGPFVAHLADIGLPAFEPAFASSAFATAAKGPLSEWLPWLKLVTPWVLNSPADASTLHTILAQLTAPDAKADPATLRLAVDAVDHLRRAPASERAALSAILVPLLDHPSLVIEASAARALGRVGGASAEPLLRARLETTKPVLLRQRALQGLSRLLGKKALPDVERLGREDSLMTTSIEIIADLKATEGIPFLKWAQKNARFGHTANFATRMEKRLTPGASSSGAP